MSLYDKLTKEQKKVIKDHNKKYPNMTSTVIKDLKGNMFPTRVPLYSVQTLMEILEPNNGFSLMHYYQLFDL